MIKLKSLIELKFIPPSQPESREGSFWWMSPEGKFYSVEGQSHVDWARNYLINSLKLSPLDVDKWKTDKHGNSPYYQLLNLGWARIGIYKDGDEKVIDYDYEKGRQISNHLLKQIKDLGIEKGATGVKRDRDTRTLPIYENFGQGNKFMALETIKKSNLKKIIKEIIKLHKSMNESRYDVDDDSHDYNDVYGGWLDPDGKFHAVGYEEHIAYAEKVLDKLGNHDPGDAYNELYKLGFMRLVFGDDVIYFRYKGWNQNLDFPNQKRMKALKDLAIEKRITKIIDCETSKQITDFEESVLKEQTTVGMKFWWMDTNYKLHPVSFEEHRYWAEKYLKNMGYAPTKDIYRMMFRLGFVRVVKYNYQGEMTLSFQYSTERALSSRQLKELRDLAIEEHCDYLQDENTNKETSLSKDLEENISEDMSYTDLLKLTTPERKDRAANVTARSLPVSVEEGKEQWNFRYKSNPQTTVTDKPFRGSITFLKGNVGQRSDAMKMKCKVDCECPDFMYRFAYNDAAKNASQVGPDSLNGAANRKPKPAYDYGEGLCKHLVALGRFLKTKISSTRKSNLFEAIDDVAKQGPFNVTYYD